MNERKEKTMKKKKEKNEILVNLSKVNFKYLWYFKLHK